MIQSWPAFDAGPIVLVSGRYELLKIAISVVNSLKAAAPILAALVLGAALASPAFAQEKPAAMSETHRPAGVRLAMPMMNAERGMYLFASKGCVSCHAVNGVGGHDATSLDAHTMNLVMNPFEFVAKMWRMAPAMIAAQEEVLGHQILFTGEEIADIIAFVHDDAHQHEFTEAMIPHDMRKMMHHVHGPKPAHQEELGHGHRR